MVKLKENDTVTFSLVVPVYNEEESLVELADRAEAVFHKMGASDSFEILYVDDGSSDGSRKVMQELKESRPYVNFIGFRKNQGKSLALMAGFSRSKGSLVITIDADLQDNPEDIPVLVEKLDDGFDVVSGQRERRNDGAIRARGSQLFNWTVSRMTGIEIHDFNCGFKVYKRSVLETIHVFGQLHRFIPVLANQQGFRIGEAYVRNSPRKYGESKYPAFRCSGFFDLLSILFTSRYAYSPMHFFGKFGLSLIIPSLLILGYLILQHVFTDFGSVQPLHARPLLLLSVLGVLIGMNIFLTGFISDLLLHHGMRKDLREMLSSFVDVDIDN